MINAGGADLARDLVLAALLDVQHLHAVADTPFDHIDRRVGNRPKQL